jgi:hypothetical protein
LALRPDERQYVVAGDRAVASLPTTEKNTLRSNALARRVLRLALAATNSR